MTKSIQKFAIWLLSAFKYLAILIVNFGVDVINAAILTIASIFHVLIQIFPTTSLDLTPPPALVAVAGYINWFIPMPAIAGSIGLICASYVAFFTVRPVLKFLQLA